MSFWSMSFLVICCLKFAGGFSSTEIDNKFTLTEVFANYLQNYLEKPESNITKQCKLQLTQYFKALFKLEPWALRMLDAGAKFPPSGILNWNLVDLGDFDMCLKVEGKLEDSTVFGKYCLGEISPPSPSDGGAKSKFNFTQNFETRMANSNRGVSVVFATCLPDSCTAIDFQELYSGIGIGIKFFDSLCQSKSTQPELNGGSIATIAFLAFVFWIMLISTIYDVYLFYSKKEPPHSLLMAFSVLTNGKKLMTTSQNSSQIGCLHGIRVISMMWVILGHRFEIERSLPKTNLFEGLKWINETINMYVMGATVSVDTFLVLSGLLVAYCSMSAMAKGVKFNIIMFYIHRLLRLTPLLAVIILIYATLLNHLGSGPIWSILITPEIQKCEQNWWSSLLYVQNYVNPQTTCVLQTWYLAVDTQLFFLSPLILIPLKRWPKIGLSLTVILLVGSMLASFLIAWFYELAGFLLANQGTKLERYMKYYYVATHTRAGPWLLGILLGYYMFKIKQSHKKVLNNKLIALAVWVVSLSILCACVFTGLNTVTDDYDRLINSFYVALLRPAWGLGVCGVIFACFTGYGGPVNWFLALPVFQIVSKLNYSMYLIHAGMEMIISSQTRTSTYFSNLQTLYMFWGDFAFTLATSILFTLAFESPIIAIEKVIFGKTRKEEPRSTEVPLEIEKKSEIP